MSLEFITLKDNIYSSCQCYAEHAHFFPSPGVDDKKQTDSVLDSFDYFLEKDREKVDDLHKSYNDRSYLSSEEVGSDESRTGEYEEAGAQMCRGKMSNEARVRGSLSLCRFRCGANGVDGLLAAHVQRRGQSSLLSDQNQPGLLHHIPEVSQNSCEPQNIEKYGTPAAMSWNVAPVCFQNGPSQ